MTRKSTQTTRHESAEQQEPASQPAADPVSKAGAAFVKGAQLFTATTAEVLSTVAQFTDQFTSTRPAVYAKDAIGKEAEISVAVPPNGTGEVIVSLGGSLRHYPARGQDGRRAFKRGDIVTVVDAGTNTLYVK